MSEESFFPPIIRGGHVLYFTNGYNNTISGTSIVNRNLLSSFSEESYTLLTYTDKFDLFKRNDNIWPVIYTNSFFGRYNKLIAQFQVRIALWRIVNDPLIKKVKVIVATNPDIILLSLAEKVASKLNIPFFPYLHDTISEAYKNTKYENYSIKVQNDVFKTSKKIFVISDALSDLYLKKYDIQTIVLRHIFNKRNEQVLIKKSTKITKLFWGGGIYDINKSSLVAFSNIISGSNLFLELTTQRSPEYLKSIGMNFTNIDVKFFPKESDYYDAIKNSDLLIIILDSTENSSTNIDEISTIFPTKTLDFLASGSPILVIADKNYFIYKFFEKHDCGFYCNSIENINDLMSIITNIESNHLETTRRINNAQKLVEDIFNRKTIMHIFHSTLNSN